MTLYRNFISLILTLLITLLFTACNSKTAQDETNTTNAQNPTTETTDDGSSTGSEGTTTGGTPSINNGGIITGGSSSTGSGGTSTGTDVNNNDTTTSGTDDNVPTGSNDGNSTEGENDDNATNGSDDNTTVGGENNTSVEQNTTTSTDITPPVITLNGEADITLEQNAVYTELSATALDAVDGNVSVSISGMVDTSTVGNYVLTYTARDSAGNVANLTRSVEVVNTAPTLTSLNLESNASILNVGDTANLTLTGTYSDNTIKTVEANVAYTVNPAENVEVNGSVLTAKKDGNVTVQAKVGITLSNTLSLNITWVVNGHVLPPEPDPTVNNATLLGVDVNHNGVRDDVERRVYATYPKAIQRAVMMQAFRTEQAMLADPDMVKNAREWAKKEDKAIDCNEYLHLYRKQKRIKIFNVVNKWQFNNEERVKKFFKYDQTLSGGVYSIREPISQDCKFDIEKVLEMDK